MAEYTDVVELMNEVHKSKGGTYDESTATEIVKLASTFYNENEDEIKSMSKSELKRQINMVYNP